MQVIWLAPHRTRVAHNSPECYDDPEIEALVQDTDQAMAGRRGRGIYIPDGYAVPCSMITVGRCQAISEPHRNPTDPDLRRRSHRKPTDETAFPGTRRHAC